VWDDLVGTLAGSRALRVRGTLLVFSVAVVQCGPVLIVNDKG
jgi:hypothetical protein